MSNELIAQDKGGIGYQMRELCRYSGSTLKELTVLSDSNDPFRLDTPTNHTNGRWFRDLMEQCGLLDRPNPLHNRGIHYAVVSLGGVMRPDGKPYKNDAESWFFLQDKASKAARWLGYVPFEAISDARNASPVIVNADEVRPEASIRSPASYNLPGVNDLLRPQILLDGFGAKQHYRIAMFGEKTSLQDVLHPMAERYGTDLYLPSGEISDTLIYTMAKTGAEDGRKMIVLILADCDPAGYQMCVSIAHKLRCLREIQFPELAFSVIAPCLTVEQVKDLGLPSTPLKETELRADGWRNRYGVEQTEIDALATLQPGVLRQIVEDAIGPYYDRTLDRRVYEAKERWSEAAHAALDAELDSDDIRGIYAEAEQHREALAETVVRMRDIVDRLDVDYRYSRAYRRESA